MKNIEHILRKRNGSDVWNLEMYPSVEDYAQDGSGASTSNNSDIVTGENERTLELSKRKSDFVDEELAVSKKAKMIETNSELTESGKTAVAEYQPKKLTQLSLDNFLTKKGNMKESAARGKPKIVNNEVFHYDNLETFVAASKTNFGTSFSTSGVPISDSITNSEARQSDTPHEAAICSSVVSEVMLCEDAPMESETTEKLVNLLENLFFFCFCTV